MSHSVLSQLEASLERLDAAVQDAAAWPVLCRQLRDALQLVVDSRGQWIVSGVTLWILASQQLQRLAAADPVEGIEQPTEAGCPGKTAVTTATVLTQAVAQRAVTSREPVVLCCASSLPTACPGEPPSRGSLPTAEALRSSRQTVHVLCAQRISDMQQLIAEFVLTDRAARAAALLSQSAVDALPRPGTDESGCEDWSLLQVCAGDVSHSQLLESAVTALTRGIAPAVSYQLLSQYSQQLHDQQLADKLLRQLRSARSLSQLADVLAQQAVFWLGQGRVSVLVPERGTVLASAELPAVPQVWRVLAITGATIVRDDVEVIRRLQTLVPRVLNPAGVQLATATAAAPAAGQWLPVDGPECATGTDSSRTVPLASELAWFAAVGVSAIRVQPLNVTAAAGSPQLCLVLELFGAAVRPQESLVQLIVAETEQTLAALPPDVAVGEPPRRWSGSRLQRWLGMAVLASLLLWLIPAELRVDVSGQAFPTERRRVFAPSDSVVEQLQVTENQEVAAEQPLLQLRSPELELEGQRLLGELESARARLQAIRATRAAGAASSGGVSRNPLELSSEEQQWDQRLQSLQAELRLLEQEQAALAVRAPVDGSIYQRALQDRLTGRPVQRGQLLLEVVRTDGPWQLELQIPERLIGHVRRAADEAAASAQPSAPRVDFCFAAEPAQAWQTRLTEINAACHLQDGQLNCLATAAVPDVPKHWLRPGAAVTARIACGRRSLGFVWFRELLEFWQRKSFSWF